MCFTIYWYNRKIAFQGNGSRSGFLVTGVIPCYVMLHTVEACYAVRPQVTQCHRFLPGATQSYTVLHDGTYRCTVWKVTSSLVLSTGPRLHLTQAKIYVGSIFCLMAQDFHINDIFIQWNHPRIFFPKPQALCLAHHLCFRDFTNDPLLFFYSYIRDLDDNVRLSFDLYMYFFVIVIKRTNISEGVNTGQQIFSQSIVASQVSVLRMSCWFMMYPTKLLLTWEINVEFPASLWTL